MGDLILYTTEDGQGRIQLRADGQTVWLTQREMSELFNVSTDNVGLHLKNIYEDGELSREATTEESSVVQIEGDREVRRLLTLYNLDAILAVGYRVRSPRGVQFRRWATTVLQVGTLFQDYDQRRKALEADAADREDEAELKALEDKIKHRSRTPHDQGTTQPTRQRNLRN